AKKKIPLGVVLAFALQVLAAWLLLNGYYASLEPAPDPQTRPHYAWLAWPFGILFATVTSIISLLSAVVGRYRKENFQYFTMLLLVLSVATLAFILSSVFVALPILSPS
ncbi:MAG: hypothetical protein AAF840_18865, partial [Bacteroidota bacterium]